MAVGLPLSPRPLTARPQLLTNGVDQRSFAGTHQRFERPGSKWAFEFTMPTMDAECAGKWIGARNLARTTGQTVLMRVPQRKGLPYMGVPRVNGAGQTGSVLAIDGLPVSDPQYLGDFQGNLRIWSQDFTQRTLYQATAVNGVVQAPDGSFTGSKIIANALSDDHSAYGVHDLTDGATYTYSVHAKAAEYGWVRLLGPVYPGGMAYFDVRNGAIGNVGPGITPRIEELPDGWFRCSISFTALAGNNNIGVAPTTGNGVLGYSGNGVSGVYVWGEQLEEAAAPTPYIPTTSSVAYRAGPRIEAGRFFSFLGADGRHYLHQVTETTRANDFGAVTIKIAPMLRVSPADNTLLNFDAPLIEGFIQGGEEWTLERLRFASFPLMIAERA